MSDDGFETRAIHAGQEPDAATGAIVPPITLATTFAQDAVGKHRGYEYARSGNPTRDRAGDVRRVAWRTRATGSRSRAASPPRTRSCARSIPATT